MQLRIMQWATGLALVAAVGSALAGGGSKPNDAGQPQSARVYSDTGAGGCLSASGCSGLSILSTGSELPAGGGETLFWNVAPTGCSAQLKPSAASTANFVSLYDASSNVYQFVAPSTGFAILRVNSSARLAAINGATSGAAAVGLRAYVVDEGDSSVDYAIGNASFFPYSLYASFTGREQSFGAASGLLALQAGRTYRLYVQGVGFIPHSSGNVNLNNVVDIRHCNISIELEFAAAATI